MRKLTDQTFADTIMADAVTVVLFTASWSGHSSLMTQIVESVEQQFDDVTFGSADADDCTDTIAKFGIRQVPSLVAFRSGMLIGIRVGHHTREDVSSYVQELIGEL